MHKRAATESLLPLRAPKQARISRQGMSADGPSASQKEGTLARWMSASLKWFERNLDFVSDYVENKALQNNAAQDHHTHRDGPRSRSAAVHKVVREARREPRTWSAPAKDRHQPTAGPSTMRSNPLPSEPTPPSPDTPLESLPVHQRRRSLSVKSQHEPEDEAMSQVSEPTPQSPETPLESLPVHQRRRSVSVKSQHKPEDELMSEEAPLASLPPSQRRRSEGAEPEPEPEPVHPPEELELLPRRCRRSLTHQAPDPEEHREPTRPPATLAPHRRSISLSSKREHDGRPSTSGAGLSSFTPKQNRTPHRSTPSRSRIPQEFISASQSMAPPLTPAHCEQVFMGPPDAKQSYLRSRAPPPSPHQPPVKTPRPNPPKRSATLVDLSPPSLTTTATASTSMSPSLPRSSTVPSSSFITTSKRDFDDALARRGLPSFDHPPRRRRKHIFDDAHKARVNEIRKVDQEEMMQALFADARSNGFVSDIHAFMSRLKYQEMLEGRGILPSAHSMMDLREAARQDEVRRRSAGDEPSREFLERAFQRVRATLDSPKPPPVWTPSLEQLTVSRRKLDDDIEQRIRPKLPDTLPPEDEADVDHLFSRRGTIAKFAREQVTDRDIARLRPNQWLNDEIIHFYGQLLLARSEAAVQAATKTRALNGINGVNRNTKKSKPLDVHYFSTFFWSKLTGEGYEKGRLSRWTKRFDIFSKDVLLIPVNHNNMHWTGAAVNFRRKRIESYDSMGSKNKYVFQVIRSYLNDEHKSKKKTPFDFTDWVDYTLPDTPQQENGYDCGVFTCQFLETLSRGEETFNFTQKNIKYLRRRMVWEIAHTQLRDEH